MYSCVDIIAGTDGTPRIERFAKMVNGLSRWLFCLGCWISSSCATPSRMEHFVKVVYSF